jgi:hypothetical protein
METRSPHHPLVAPIRKSCSKSFHPSSFHPARSIAPRRIPPSAERSRLAKLGTVPTRSCEVSGTRILLGPEYVRWWRELLGDGFAEGTFESCVDRLKGLAGSTKRYARPPLLADSGDVLCCLYRKPAFRSFSSAYGLVLLSFGGCHREPTCGLDQ